MKKRLLSLILTLVLAAAAFPFAAGSEVYAGSAYDDVKFTPSVHGIENGYVYLNVSFSYSGIGGGYNDYGVALYDSSKTLLKSYSTGKIGSASAATVVDNISVKDSLNYTLEPGTKYFYKIWTDFGFETVSSDYYAFTTAGKPPVAPSWKTVKLSSASVVEGTPVTFTHEATNAKTYTVIAEDYTGKQVYFNYATSDAVSDSIVFEEAGRYDVYARAVNDYGMTESARLSVTVTAKPSSVKVTAALLSGDETTADIQVTVTAANMLPYTRLGADIYDASDKKIGYYYVEHAVPSNAKRADYTETIKFNTFVDAKLRLEPGKTYKYKPYVVIGGATTSEAGGTFVAGAQSGSGSGSGSGASGSMPFTDVPKNWSYDYISRAYAEGLVNGKTPTEFKPNDDIKMSEVLKLAACLRDRMLYGANSLENSKDGRPWYMSYYDYLNARGLLEAPGVSYTDFNRPVTRGEMVRIFFDAIPAEYYAQRNTVADGSIPDVAASQQTYGTAVYTLYRAGIIAGSDEYGTFNPDSKIRRSEVAAILVRILDASKRVNAPAKLGQKQ